MVLQILSWFGLQFSTTQPTPLAVHQRLTGPFHDEPFESSGPYTDLVGWLILGSLLVASLGACAASLVACVVTSPSAPPAEASFSFTLESRASQCFFCNHTSLTPLSFLFPFALADPASEPVIARSSTNLQRTAVPSGVLSGLHIPSFSRNLVGVGYLQDCRITATFLGHGRTAIYTVASIGALLDTFTEEHGSEASPTTLWTWSPGVASEFRVEGCIGLVRDTSADKLSARALPMSSLVSWWAPVSTPFTTCPSTGSSTLQISALPRQVEIDSGGARAEGTDARGASSEGAGAEDVGAGGAEIWSPPLALAASEPPLQPRAQPLATRQPPLGPPAAPRPPSRPSCSLRTASCTSLAAPCGCLPCSLRCPASARPTCCATMASLCVLAFDHEGRPIQFDTCLDDLQLYLLSDSRDSVSLFDHTSGAAPAPPATAESANRSQWLTRDAAACLAIRNHLPLAECAHFGQHRTAQALYDAVVARYSSPATAALGHLLMPYLFPELSAFATVEDLVSNLCTSDARYRAAVPAEFLDRNQPPMFITLYFIVTRLPYSLRSIRDQFLALDPTALTVDLLEQHLLAAETSVVAIGAAHGTLRTPFFEGCSVVQDPSL
ncbi:unnamed protein product [Closterium sp. NIES-54]